MSAIPAELICFDLGRVLVRICEGWADACQRAEVPVAPDAGHPTVKAELGAAVEALEVGAIDLAAFGARVAPLAEGMTPDHVAAAVHVYLRGLYPGVAELLDELHASGLATACLSNTNATHWRIMFEAPEAEFIPLGRLHHRFASHLVGARKPAASVYEHVERTTGIEAGRIVFFDDLAENVEAARARGWRAHRVDPADPPAPQMRLALQAEGVLQS